MIRKLLRRCLRRCSKKQPRWVVCENPDELGYWIERRQP